MSNIIKIGCGAIFAGLIVAASQTGTAQAGRKYIYPKDQSYKSLPFSEAVLAGDTLYVAGHIGTEAKSGQAPANLDQEMKLLFDGFRADMAEANFKMDDLVSVRVYTTDLALYDKFNAVYRAQFAKDMPSRAFIGVASLLRGGHFEMEGVAVRSR